ncbi:MAG TPA: VOC family protein [Candidatus Saccharimonadales bacterium]
MFKNSKAFSSFSVKDLSDAKDFYEQTLGLTVKEIPQGLMLEIAGTNGVFLYPKPDHQPASYTCLNFRVDNIDEAVNALKEKGVTFEQYDEMTDEDGIARGLTYNQGPDIAWFKDPSGNILSVLQEEKNS